MHARPVPEMINSWRRGQL